jgi:predicted nucleic acid-binding protein
MTLVDTSVWIAVFRRDDPLDLLQHVAFGDIVTCLPVIEEVLQGIRDEQAFRRTRAAMLALPIVASPMPAAVYLRGAELYRAARRSGVTVRSSADCLIAACALVHDLELLHVDSDFDALARVAALRVRRV